MGTKLGIIAGGGILPLRLVEKCQKTDRPYFLIGLKDQIDSKLFNDIDYVPLRIGDVGTAINLFQENDVCDIVMAGHVKRPNLKALKPDAKALKILTKSGAMALGDDGLLKSVIKYLESEEGFNLISVDSILDEGALSPGPLGVPTPDEQALKDIARGVETLKIIAPADIGQAVVVQDAMVIAVEAVEGTALMLTRCKDLLQQGNGGVLVKIRKRGQETRIDMPTIGPDTIAQIKGAGLAGVAIDAGGMIILDRQETIAAADAAGLFIHAVNID